MDGRGRNIGAQRYEGADLSLRYRAPVGGGRALTVTVNATWLDSRQQLLPGLPVPDLAGTSINSPHFRAAGGASLGGNRFTIAPFGEFTGGGKGRARAVRAPGRPRGHHNAA